MDKLKSPYDIALLILKESFSIPKDGCFLRSDKDKYFFSSELSFYLFFLIAGNCLVDNLCNKDFIKSIENELALLHSKGEKSSSEDYKNIIRNRFASYKSTISNSAKERTEERENLYLYFVKEDIKKGGFSLANAPDSLLVRVNDPLHRVLYNMYIKKLLEIVDFIIEEIKKNK